MRKVRATAISSMLLLVLAAFVRAHEGHDDAPAISSQVEISEVITSALLLLSFVVYLLGVSRLWRTAGRARGISLRSAMAFCVGLLSMTIALVGPFHSLSETLFSAHMTQHEILMLIAAPLIVMGRPQVAFLWALPVGWRHVVKVITHAHSFESTWRLISGSFAAFLIHAAALWIWHIPALFDATLESDVIHALQHASFFGTALLFWWAIVNGSLDWKSSFVGVLFLFLTSLHSGILGAFLTFTREVWYPVYQNTTASYGLTPLEDQQLGGLIMWVPAGLVYIGAGLAMFARLLAQSEKRAVQLDAGLLAGEGVSNL